VATFRQGLRIRRFDEPEVKVRMRIYRVLCADISREHGHVRGLSVRKWRVKKRSYGKRRVFDTQKVIEKIDAGDVFRTRSRDRSASVSIVHRSCEWPDCSEPTLSTISDGMARDDLDYMRCS
jgi:hypothetical protein